MLCSKLPSSGMGHRYMLLFFLNTLYTNFKYLAADFTHIALATRASPIAFTVWQTSFSGTGRNEELDHRKASDQGSFPVLDIFTSALSQHQRSDWQWLPAPWLSSYQLSFARALSPFASSLPLRLFSSPRSTVFNRGTQEGLKLDKQFYPFQIELLLSSIPQYFSSSAWPLRSCSSANRQYRFLSFSA